MKEHLQLLNIRWWLCMYCISCTSGTLAAHDRHDGLENPSNMMCGPVCVWYISTAFGQRRSLADICSLVKVDHIRGTTIRAIVEAAAELGIPAEAVLTDVNGLKHDRRIAVILLYPEDDGHFVLIDTVGNETVRVIDGTVFTDIPLREFSTIWQGHAILFGSKVRHIGLILPPIPLMCCVILLVVCLCLRLARTQKPRQKGVHSAPD